VGGEKASKNWLPSVVWFVLTLYQIAAADQLI